MQEFRHFVQDAHKKNSFLSKRRRRCLHTLRDQERGRGESERVGGFFSFVFACSANNVSICMRRSALTHSGWNQSKHASQRRKRPDPSASVPLQRRHKLVTPCSPSNSTDSFSCDAASPSVSAPIASSGRVPRAPYLRCSSPRAPAAESVFAFVCF